MLTKQMRLDHYAETYHQLGPLKSVLTLLTLLGLITMCIRTFYNRVSGELLVTLMYVLLYFVASPFAIVINKVLMKDYGFGYPVMVSALGQSTTAVCSAAVVKGFGLSVENGRHVGLKSLATLGGASAFALVLGQYPYLYLTVAFIQMLKAFSPTYMIFFLYCLGVEQPSRAVIGCVLGLSLFTAVASAGEVNFHLVGVLFMAAASGSDAVRLVLAQKLLTNHKMAPMETLYYISPLCVLWMVPFILLELPVALKHDSFSIVTDHPLLFIGAGCSGFFVNITSFLLVKRTSSMTFKLLTMMRNGGLVLASGLFFGETITRLEAFGYGGLMLCFGLYTYVKANESAAAAAASKGAVVQALVSSAPEERGGLLGQARPLTDDASSDDAQEDTGPKERSRV